MWRTALQLGDQREPPQGGPETGRRPAACGEQDVLSPAMLLTHPLNPVVQKHENTPGEAVFCKISGPDPSQISRSWRSRRSLSNCQGARGPEETGQPNTSFCSRDNIGGTGVTPECGVRTTREHRCSDFDYVGEHPCWQEMVTYLGATGQPVSRLFVYGLDFSPSVFDTLLLSDPVSCPLMILSFLCPSPRVSHLSKETWFFFP